ncbi:MAG: hypothetical protein AAF639_04785 [Chloroflexota bacterium]
MVRQRFNDRYRGRFSGLLSGFGVMMVFILLVLFATTGCGSANDASALSFAPKGATSVHNTFLLFYTDN